MNNNNGSKFWDGFLWGAILGGVVVYVLGTEQGRKIIKSITENGIDNLNEMLEDVDDYEFAIDQDPKGVSTEDVNPETPAQSEKQEFETAFKPKSRRFFKSSKGKL